MLRLKHWGFCFHAKGEVASEAIEAIRLYCELALVALAERATLVQSDPPSEVGISFTVATP